ncbi:MAG: HPF/RaiA family ribosome-associated protein [Chthoniobacter sp.]|nr:HPF/RaiA family ribosome-associated protein [Chthoniobacter sp.]
MKLILSHRHHQPSPSFTALIRQQIEILLPTLQIDEARIFVEHRHEASPAFRVTAHLVTPGPDVFAEAVDHTLRAALQKMIGQLETRIGHRHEKRARHRRLTNKTAPRPQLAASAARH